MQYRINIFLTSFLIPLWKTMSLILSYKEMLKCHEVVVPFPMATSMRKKILTKQQKNP